MDYDATIRWLFGLQKFGIKLGLSNIRAILAALGEPQDRLTSVLVGGTNGKGSTAAALASLARAAGLSVGLYTSPHLQRFNERIQVDGRPITDAEVVAQTIEIRDVVERINENRMPAGRIAVTFFEFTTAMAIRHFLAAGVDLAVLEVGMGGRLDATNVVPALVSVITHVDLEHRQHLGDTIEAIAFEKAGIIHEGGAAVTAETKPESLAVLRRAARERNATLHELGRDFAAAPEDGGTFRYRSSGLSLGGLRVGIPGANQIENAACALAAWEILAGIRRWPVDDPTIRRGLRDVRLPGRLERIRERPPVFLDVSHNPDAAFALARFFAAEVLPHGLSPVALVGLMADKDYRGYLAQLARIAREVIVTRAQVPDARDPVDLSACVADLGLPCTIAPTVAEGMELLGRRLAADGRAGLVCGSFYVVGEAMDFLDRRPGWPGDTA